MSKFKSVFVLSLLALSALFFTVTERTHAQLEIGTPPPIVQMSDVSCSIIVISFPEEDSPLIDSTPVTNGGTVGSRYFRVTYVVKNEGPGTAHNFSLHRGVQMNGDNLYFFPANLTLSPGEQYVFAPIPLTADWTGDFVSLWGRVDGENNVVETNERNNMCRFQFSYPVAH